MKRVLSLTRLVAAFLLIQSTFARELPPAPPGFAWQEIPELKAALLRPNGWFFKREKQKDTLAYFITQENIDNGGEFQTGLTVNVSRRTDSAVERAKRMVERIASTKHGEKWAKEVGPFKEFGCLSKDSDANGTTLMQTLAVANPKTNTLYLFMFESPESNWDAAWKTGKQIMDTLALDDGM
jgi:hypothetical protein